MKDSTKFIIKNTIILCLLTCVCVAALIGVDIVTKEPRSKQDEKAKISVYKEVLANTSSIKKSKVNQSKLNKQLNLKDLSADKVVINDIVTGFDHNGDVAGYIITVTSKEGYSGDIMFNIGFKVDGTIEGISILSIGETDDYSLKTSNNDILANIKGKRTEFFELVIGNKTGENQIDAISGATKTSNAIINATNAAIIAYNNIDYDKDITTEVVTTENLTEESTTEINTEETSLENATTGGVDNEN